MLLFDLVLIDGTIIRAATEYVDTGTELYKPVIKTVSDFSFRSRSQLGGLVKVDFGSITLFSDTFSAYQEYFTVRVYRYTATGGKRLLVNVMATYSEEPSEDLIVYTLWTKELTALATTQTTYTGFVGAGDAVNELAGLLGLGTVTMHEETTWTCTTKVVANATSIVPVRVGDKIFDLLDDLLAARGCIGVVNSGMLDVYSVLTGHGDEISAKRTDFVSYRKKRIKVKNLTIKSVHSCDDTSDASSSYTKTTGGTVDTTTNHTIATHGADITVNGFAEFTTDRPSFVSTYTELLGNKTVEAVVTDEYDLQVGDLVILTDESDATFLVSGLKFNANTDTYTVYGIEVGYTYTNVSGSTWEWIPDVCADWSTSGTLPTSTITYPSTTETISGPTIDVEWNRVNWPVLYVLIQDRTGSSPWPDWFGVCGSEVVTDGNKQRATITHNLATGTYTLVVLVGGVDTGTLTARTITIT